MMALDSLALAVVFAAVFFYILYGVVRAAVRDGILQAADRQQKPASVGASASGEAS